jgi:hypothetical protein
MYAAKKNGKNRMRHVLVGAHSKRGPHCESLAIKIG